MFKLFFCVKEVEISMEIGGKQIKNRDTLLKRIRTKAMFQISVQNSYSGHFGSNSDNLPKQGEQILEASFEPFNFFQLKSNDYLNLELYQQIRKMNYFFTPFALVNQYQPYYGFLPQILVQEKSYYPQESKSEKQLSAEKQNTFSFERQVTFKTIDQTIDSQKKCKKSKKKQDKNFGFREQDKERNIFSNIIKGFFLTLIQKRLMDQFVEQLIAQNGLNMEIQYFLEKVTQIFSKCRSYFSPKSVRQILRIEKGEEEVRKMVQICLYRYLKIEFSINLLLSKRIKRKSKLLQMKKARELLAILRGSE